MTSNAERHAPRSMLRLLGLWLLLMMAQRALARMLYDTDLLAGLLAMQWWPASLTLLAYLLRIATVVVLPGLLAWRLGTWATPLLLERMSGSRPNPD